MIATRWKFRACTSSPMTGTGKRRRQFSVCTLSNSIGRWPLVEHVLPGDFKEFLKLLNDAEVEYLLIGGYAVGYHGYPRPVLCCA